MAETYDQTGLEALAAGLAPTLRAGDAVLLSGPLGVGKTVFARALIRAVVGDPGLEVPSPSYTLVQAYEAGGRLISHFDLWRLDGPEGLAELGWDDAIAGVVLVEWPDRLGSCKPERCVEIGLSVAGEGCREVVLHDRRRGVHARRTAPANG